MNSDSSDNSDNSDSVLWNTDSIDNTVTKKNSSVFIVIKVHCQYD